jgi:serine/threonine protein kinase
VILYILLCANQPFGNDKCIPNARFNTEISSYKKLSDDAKDILQKIFRVDPRHRATADQLLRHRWITKNTHNYNNLMTEEYISGIRRWKYSRELKNNLKNRFEACRKMKDKVIESLNRYSLTHLLTLTLSLVDPVLTHSLTYLLLLSHWSTQYSLTHSLTYLLTHYLTYLLTYLLTHLLTHLLTFVLSSVTERRSKKLEVQPKH